MNPWLAGWLITAVPALVISLRAARVAVRTPAYRQMQEAGAVWWWHACIFSLALARPPLVIIMYITGTRPRR